MNATIKLKARAKINLTLDVVGKRANGYHDVEMIMQQIDLYDVVTVHCLEKDEIILTSNEPFLPLDDRNIAYKAAALMKKTYQLPQGFHIHIDKHIPIAAGLAGGSTNAAAVIKAINKLCALNLPLDTQMSLGFKLGADVPFCFLEGCALATGLGEILEPIRGFELGWLVLVKPNFGVSTKEVYTELKLEAIITHPRTGVMREALEQQNRKVIINELSNVLETVTLSMYPKVAQVKALLSSYGAEGVLMSGSGPTVFGIFSSYQRAKTAHKKLKKIYTQSYVVSTYNGK